LDNDAVGQTNLNDAVITRGVGLTGANVQSVGLTAQSGLFYDSSTPRPIVVIETVHPEEAGAPTKIKAELTFGCPTCQKPCRDCGLNEWSNGLPPTCKGGSHERGRTSPVGGRVSIGSGALGWRVAG
jgi:hypothetical protein